MPRPRELVISTRGQGLHEITHLVREALRDIGVVHGVCIVFVRHTSASLIIQENADPTARRDLERWLSRLVPENDPIFEHNDEGPDDMPAHIKAALTATSLTIPISDGDLTLGTWQGIYLWEHRRAAHQRRVVVQALGE
jgi:secondary thiamine-phosphate synthase enzyme